MHIEIVIPSDHMFLGIPDSVIQEIGSELPFSQRELDELSTSVIEACTNAIEHGNGLHSSVETRIHFDFSAERFEVKVFDHGEGFDYQSRDFTRIPEDLMQERGRGLYMMHSFCNEIAFYKEDGFFVVQLVKIPSDEADGDREKDE